MTSIPDARRGAASVALIFAACTAPVDDLRRDAPDVTITPITSADRLQLKGTAMHESGGVLFVVRHASGVRIGGQRVIDGPGTTIFRYEDGLVRWDETLEADLEVVRTQWARVAIVSGAFTRATTILGRALFSGGGFDTFVARNGLGVDALGRVYVAGRFQLSLDIDGIGATGVAGDDAFVARLDEDGRPAWILPLATAGRDAISALAVSPTEGAYVTGTLDGTLDLGAFELSADRPSPYLLEIDPFGRPVRGRVFDGDADLSVLVVDERTHDLWMAGTFRGALALDATYAAIGQSDIVIARVAPDFSIEAARYGGAMVDVVEAAALDRYGRLWLIGSLRGTQPLVPGRPVDDGLDGFLVALEHPALVRDRRRIGGAGDQIGAQIGVDAQGRIRFTGETDGPFEVRGSDQIPSDPGIFLGILDR